MPPRGAIEAVFKDGQLVPRQMLPLSLSYDHRVIDGADAINGDTQAIVDTLIGKTLRALEQTGYETLVVAGGVGANRSLRERLAEGARRAGARVYYPRIEFCTDNAAMIAVAGMARLKAGEHEGPAIRARATWSLSDLVPLAALTNS